MNFGHQTSFDPSPEKQRWPGGLGSGGHLAPLGALMVRSRQFCCVAFVVQTNPWFGEVVDPTHGSVPPASTVDAEVKPAMHGVGSPPAFVQFPLKTTPMPGPLQSMDTMPVQGSIVCLVHFGTGGHGEVAPETLLA